MENCDSLAAGVQRLSQLEMENVALVRLLLAENFVVPWWASSHLLYSEENDLLETGGGYCFLFCYSS